MATSPYRFQPRQFEQILIPLIREIDGESELDAKAFNRIVRRHPKPGGGSWSKSEILRSFRFFAPSYGWLDRERSFVEKVRMKPIRTASGVAPVTVLTKPFPCPGKCIFCPNDVRMPKSYLSREPGAQRAAQHDFDPFAQTLGRLWALYNTGHAVDKVEMIVLGGTWSFYPESYQIWFVKRCFDAMNAFDPKQVETQIPHFLTEEERRYHAVPEEVDGASFERTYNQVIREFLREEFGGLEDYSEAATWEQLEEEQQVNERSRARCVGLVLETRPDHLEYDEVRRLRRLGATKVQIGIQSLNDEVLELNRRGHDVAATHRALHLLRQAGFKLHAHWMPNLYGSNPEADVEDFQRLFDDVRVRPDELKIYPCSLVETAELMKYYEDGSWRPYEGDELLKVLTESLLSVPRYCRVTRVIRDIPGDDIVTGNKVTNFREVAERELSERGTQSKDIRSREIRREPVDPERLTLRATDYETAIGDEVFFEFVTPEDRIVGFSRLALPGSEQNELSESKEELLKRLPELKDAALLREVHVYGVVTEIGRQTEGRSQHLGLGRRLVEAAAQRAAEAGFTNLAVISAIGTRDYYRGLGFEDGELYQHLALKD